MGTPLHAWDQLQEIWTAMLMVRDSMLAEERSTRAGDDLLRKTKKKRKEGRKKRSWCEKERGSGLAVERGRDFQLQRGVFLEDGG